YELHFEYEELYDYEINKPEAKALLGYLPIIKTHNQSEKNFDTYRKAN
ncbi:15138_t:CDS:2, partial [Funneliformis geosporum]